MLEIEAKFLLHDEATARRLVDTWGLVWQPGRFEINRIYDFADGRLHESGALVRLRQRGDEQWLTFKEKTDVEVEHAKVRQEFDSTVGNPQAIARLLVRLGLSEVMRYERYRARYPVEHACIEVDHLPGGWFCEIEGTPEAIARQKQAAGLRDAQVITWSYPEIFRRLADYLRLDAQAWTFDLADAGGLVLPSSGDLFWERG